MGDIFKVRCSTRACLRSASPQCLKRAKQSSVGILNYLIQVVQLTFFPVQDSLR